MVKNAELWLPGVLSRAFLPSQGAVAAVRLEVGASSPSSTAARKSKFCVLSLLGRKNQFRCFVTYCQNYLVSVQQKTSRQIFILNRDIIKNMKKCPFCERSRILDENDLACVLASNPRLVFGHLLVVPKRHVEKPWNLRDDEIMAVWNLIKKYQKLLAERVGDGCDVRENYRPFLQQTKLKVNHLHWHLIPRKNQDELYAKSQIGEQGIFRDLANGELSELAKILGM